MRRSFHGDKVLALIELCKLRDRVIVMPSDFGERNTAEQLSEKWFPRTLGVQFGSGYNLLETAQTWRKGREAFLY
jgi:hypothetical protein